MLRIPFAVASAGLAAALLAAPAHADPVIYPPSYGSSGVYGVLGHANDALQFSIPPGHYRAYEAPGILKGTGFWLRCSGTPCAPTHPNNIIGTGETAPDGALMEILPSDTAVYLYNATLTFAG
jgi:hypothetical protein